MARVRSRSSVALLSPWSRCCWSANFPDVTSTSVLFSYDYERKKDQSALRSVSGLPRFPASLGHSRSFASTGVDSSNQVQHNRATDAAAVLKVASYSSL